MDTQVTSLHIDQHWDIKNCEDSEPYWGKFEKNEFQFLLHGFQNRTVDRSLNSA